MFQVFQIFCGFLISLKEKLMIFLKFEAETSGYPELGTGNSEV
jgi:hypothetical protein